MTTRPDPDEQKLEPEPAKPRFLINEPGIRYRLKVQ